MEDLLCPLCRTSLVDYWVVREQRNLSDPGGGARYVRARCRDPLCPWTGGGVRFVAGDYSKIMERKRRRGDC